MLMLLWIVDTVLEQRPCFLPKSNLHVDRILEFYLDIILLKYSSFQFSPCRASSYLKTS